MAESVLNPSIIWNKILVFYWQSRRGNLPQLPSMGFNSKIPIAQQLCCHENTTFLASNLLKLGSSGWRGISGISGAFGQNFKCSEVQIFCPNGFAIKVGVVCLLVLLQLKITSHGWRCNSALLWLVIIQSPLGIQGCYCSTLGTLPCPLGESCSTPVPLEQIQSIQRDLSLFQARAALASHQGDRAWESPHGGWVPRALAQESKRALKTQ